MATVGKVQPCKYGCGAEIQTRLTDKGWRPFLESGVMHDCPNSPYNKQKKQEAASKSQMGFLPQTATATATGTDNREKEANDDVWKQNVLERLDRIIELLGGAER